MHPNLLVKLSDLRSFSRGSMHAFSRFCRLFAATILLPAALLLAADVDTKFHNAPASAQAMKNPYQGQDAATAAGKQLYAHNCASCHGVAGKGTGNVPSLVDGKLDFRQAGRSVLVHHPRRQR
jgi:mono/diheme cytochrome c family protein